MSENPIPSNNFAQASNIETSEFEKCYDYSDTQEPVEIDCSEKILGQTILLGMVKWCSG